MRRSLVVAIAAMMAAVALTGLPAPAGSQSRTLPRALQAATLTSVSIPALASAPAAPGSTVVAPEPEDVLGEAIFVEPGRRLKVPARRARVDQPVTASSSAWKPPRYSVSGTATFYDTGSTAMRLPRGQGHGTRARKRRPSPTPIRRATC